MNRKYLETTSHVSTGEALGMSHAVEVPGPGLHAPVLSSCGRDAPVSADLLQSLSGPADPGISPLRKAQIIFISF